MVQHSFRSVSVVWSFPGIFLREGKRFLALSEQRLRKPGAWLSPGVSRSFVPVLPDTRGHTIRQRVRGSSRKNSKILLVWPANCSLY
jgi:hypothetical protein